MSNKIKDYLSIVKNGIANGDKIIEALWVSTQVKNGKVSEAAVAEIMKRKEICKACPFNSKNAAANGLHVPHAPYEEFCIHCLCRIGGDDSKEYCLSCNCGIKEWNKLNPTNKMPLKWSAFTEE
jgi:hypothetical protein